MKPMLTLLILPAIFLAISAAQAQTLATDASSGGQGVDPDILQEWVLFGWATIKPR